jgi:hypothetical protein
MKTKHKFRASFRDGSSRDIHARSLTHALGLIANQDLLLSVEPLDERENTKPAGIYATHFSIN